MENVDKTMDVNGKTMDVNRRLFLSSCPSENAPVGMVTEECGQWAGEDNDWNSREEEI